MLPHLTPRQLDAFIAAAELSNFTLAARRLNLTPSAVSSLIGELELSVGFALFERTTRKVSLTSDGREFLPAALAVQRQMRHAATAAANVRNRSIDIVQIAAPLSVASVVLPPLIAAYRAERPRTGIRILDTGVEWLADRVATSDADLALGPDRAVSADVICEPLFSSPWVLWCSPHHALAAKAALTWRDLDGVDYYASGRDHEHSVMPQLAQVPDAQSLAPVQVVENLTTALGLAAANLGVTFSPAYAEPLALSLGLVMRKVIGPEIVRSMALYSPARRRLSTTALEVQAFLRARLTGTTPGTALIATPRQAHGTARPI